VGSAYDGSGWVNIGFAGYVVNSTGTISTGSIPTDYAINTGSSNFGSERLRITSGGYVGIGTTGPRAMLDVSGTLVGNAATLNSTTTIDGSTGNLQYTNASCGSFQFNNLKDGGTYMFAVKGTTAATCTFTAYSDAGTTALTVHMPPDNGPTTNGKHTIFNLGVIGSDVYVSWIPGY
jgi:hypothetical protein